MFKGLFNSNSNTNKKTNSNLKSNIKTNLKQSSTKNNSGWGNLFSNTKTNIKTNTKTNLNTKTSNNMAFLKATDTKSVSIKIGIVVLILFIIYITICFVKYYESDCPNKKNFFYYLFDFYDTNICITNDYSPKPLNALVNGVNPTKLIIDDIERNEVFHISNQDYTYDQAKCKCAAYGAKLATKSQMIDAYNNGASWCDYGWSEGQNAFYPVQQCDWDKLNPNHDRIKDHPELKDAIENHPILDEIVDRFENHSPNTVCGKPGLNGGYFANPNLKFGINCYGRKPSGQVNKLKKPYCPPVDFCTLESNSNAAHKLDTDDIAPFSPDKWNEHI